MMATAGLNGTVILWDVSQRDAPHRRGPDLPSGAGSYNGLAFSPDGHTLATADDASVRLWAVDDADHPTLLEPPPTDEHTPVYAVAFSQDGARLAAAGTGADVSVWDVTDRTQPRPLVPPMTGHRGPVYGLAFAPEGTNLASASNDQTVMLWDLARRNQPVAFAPVDVGGVVFDLTFPDVGTLTTLASTHTVDIWQIADGALRPATQRHTDGLADSARLSADGAVLVTVDDVSDGDDPLGTRNRQIQVWSARGQGDCARSAGPIASSTARIAVSAAPPYTLVTAELDGTLRLWDVDLAGRVTPLGLPFNENTGIAFAVALSADGHTLAVGSENGTVRFWDLADRSRPRALPPITSGNTIPLTTLAFAPDASLLATVSEDGTGQLWDVADQARRGRFTQSSRSYTPESLALRFSPDGRTLAYSTTDRLSAVGRHRPRPAPAGGLRTDRHRHRPADRRVQWGRVNARGRDGHEPDRLGSAAARRSAARRC